MNEQPPHPFQVVTALILVLVFPFLMMKGLIDLDARWGTPISVAATPAWGTWEHFIGYPERDSLFAQESEADYLLRMGRNGWELCAILPASPSGHAYYFKRKKQP